MFIEIQITAYVLQSRNFKSLQRMQSKCLATCQSKSANSVGLALQAYWKNMVLSSNLFIYFKWGPFFNDPYINYYCYEFMAYD